MITDANQIRLSDDRKKLIMRKYLIIYGQKKLSDFY